MASSTLRSPAVMRGDMVVSAEEAAAVPMPAAEALECRDAPTATTSAAAVKAAMVAASEEPAALEHSRARRRMAPPTVNAARICESSGSSEK